jgi:hypothetical protein
MMKHLCFSWLKTGLKTAAGLRFEKKATTSLPVFLQKSTLEKQERLPFKAAFHLKIRDSSTRPRPTEKGYTYK